MDWRDKFSIAVPVLGLGVPMVGFVVSATNPDLFPGSPLAWLLLLLWAVLSELTTKALKRAVVRLFPSVTAFARPERAVQSDAFASGGNRGRLPGFPSGHASMVAMYATILVGGVGFLWAGARATGAEGAALAAHRSGGALLMRTLLAAVLAVGCVGVNAHVRIAKGCHNRVQVVGGTVWGGLLGVGFAVAARALLA